MKTKLLAIVVALFPMFAYAGSDQFCYKDSLGGGAHCVYGNGSRLDAGSEVLGSRHVTFTDAFGNKTELNCRKATYGDGMECN